MREPSIHITESNLELVINKIKDFHDIGKLSSKELAKLLVTKSKGKSCNSRVIIVSNDRLEKKTQKVLKSSKEDANLLATIIYMVRKRKKHRGITKMTQDHREWGQLKDLTEVCVQFCNDFGLQKKQGFVKYIELGINKITSTRNYISKLTNMGETIATEYEAVQTIQDDPRREESKEIHDYYVSLISKRTGIVETYENKPTKYLNFIKISEITDELDIPYDIFIDAQFEGLAWADSYPDPNQLVGDKAMERLNKYLFENKIRKGKSDETKKKDKVKSAFDKLKGL